MKPAVDVAAPRVTCRGITVVRGGRALLDDVSLTLPAGRWLTVLGPNGAGKTTLLAVVSGVLRPDAGEVLVDGTPVAALRPRQRAQRLAVVPQLPVVPAGMTLGDYVLLGRTPHTGPFATERRSDLAAVAEALALLDLVEMASRPLSTLSGGERQRAFLARAVAQSAPTLLLDEPTAALDAGRAQQVLELVDRLRRERGLTVLSTMHDLTLSAQYADDLVLLRSGRVVAHGSPDDVLTEATVARHYGAHVRVFGSGRSRAVVPVRDGVPLPSDSGATTPS